jgi:HTH-type transcriptional regulator/antitoxin HigA
MEALIFSSADIQEPTGHFSALTAKVPLHPIKCAEEYEQAVRTMDALLDAGAADENHPLTHLVSALGEFIKAYDDTHFQLPETSPGEVLRVVMKQNNVKQSELPEIGSQGVVSEVLNGKRELNARQIRDVSKRFGISPAVFFTS